VAPGRAGMQLLPLWLWPLPLHPCMPGPAAHPQVILQLVQLSLLLLAGPTACCSHRLLDPLQLPFSLDAVCKLDLQGVQASGISKASMRVHDGI
jgi:hypothetical protein